MTTATSYRGDALAERLFGAAPPRPRVSVKGLWVVAYGIAAVSPLAAVLGLERAAAVAMG